MEQFGKCQVIMATHSPLLMAYPRAQLLLLSKYALSPIALEQTEHFRAIARTCADPAAFVDTALKEDD